MTTSHNPSPRSVAKAVMPPSHRSVKAVPEGYFWTSWYWTDAMGAFTLYHPWWISGMRLSDDAETVCAAIHAKNEDEAKAIVRDSYDKRPKRIEWRFCDWEVGDPLSNPGGRFPPAKWMKWPPVTPLHRGRRKGK